MNYTIKTTAYKEKGENFTIFCKNCLTVKTKLNYIKHALAKSKASREKLNLSMANNCTPKRAFFVRIVYLSTKNSFISDKLFFSMVERNGQPLAVGCFPLMAVSHPVTFYRPTVRSQAVVSKTLSMETTKMIQFIFAAIRRADLSNQIQKIRIQAPTEEAARRLLAREFILVLAGKINPQSTPTRGAHLATQGGAL